MHAITRGSSDTGAVRGRRSAAGFFWVWLIIATSMSITGNVAHAVVHAAVGTVGLAAGAALVPPVVLLASTHSMAVLVRIRASGYTYWCALMMTVALAACAFVLSFDALRSLAIMLGLPPAIAWLWPCAIDVAIAQATLCLLSLSWRAAVAGVNDVAAKPLSPQVAPKNGQPQTAAVRPNPQGRPSEPGSRRGGASVRAPAGENSESAPGAMGPVDTADIERWQQVAESIVRDGVTSKHPRLVAAILAQREAGVPPSTIGRHHNVHHTTVGRILSAAETLSLSS